MKNVIEAFLHNNQFASGGFMLMILGGAAVYLKSIPVKIWDWIVKHTTLTISVNEENDAFDWVKWWFSVQPYAKKARRVEALGTNRFTPAVGTHWWFSNGTPVFLTFYRNEASVSDKRREQYTIRIVGRSQKRLRALLEEMHEAYLANYRGELSAKTWSRNGWDWRNLSLKLRSMDTVVLDPSVKEKVLRDMKWFQNNEAWYDHLGIPYHRGYLFYGKPGSGKTSLINALARELSVSPHFLKLEGLPDDQLSSAIRRAERGAIIVLEDIDSLKSTANREKLETEKSAPAFGVSLSSILNVLDGHETPHGVIFIMTTNHIEKLDPALIRSGRIDFRMEFGFATPYQSREIIHRFFPDMSQAEVDALAASRPEETVSSLQGFLMQTLNQRTAQ